MVRKENKAFKWVVCESKTRLDLLIYLNIVYQPKRALRYATKRLLIVPKSFTTTYGYRAFSIAAPKLWNNLPDSIKYAETVKQFISLVKTYLFKEAFD